VFVTAAFEPADRSPEAEEAGLPHTCRDTQSSGVNAGSPTALAQHCMKVGFYFLSGFSAAVPVMLWIRKWLTNLWEDRLSLKYLRHIAANQVQLLYSK